MAGKILTGAPRLSDLDWSEAAYLKASEASSFIDSSGAKFGPDTSRFRSIGELDDERQRIEAIGQIRDVVRQTSPRAPSSPTDTVEDVGVLDGMLVVEVPDDMTLGDIYDNPEHNYLSTGKANTFPSSFKDIENEEYLEQSLMLYDNSLLTRLSLTPSFDSATFNSLPTQESSPPYSSSASLKSTPSQLPKIYLPSPIIHLKRLPNATYINQIAPQTITVHLIAAVVSIAPPRNIKLRQTNRKMDLVEMIVADETRAGFQISFWLPADPEKKDPTRKTLKELKPKDLILIKNVALHVWNGTVFGQSLRKGWTKTETTITTWARNGVLEVQVPDKTESPEAAKLQRVFDYAERFLSARPIRGWKYEIDEGKKSIFQDELPPETQTSVRQTRIGTEY
ncbi:hypothetical protein E6O75_ATG08703 [Venturia nashicola]|uniref:Uncharacterized protein n=1 Tax=Venturia nashicola TaxID=86259 RepID=A0A4Z1NGS9_9PEZI|nr:hypothetical protein E6O75_ATG08703 [Venturia nashicola]